MARSLSKRKSQTSRRSKGVVGVVGLGYVGLPLACLAAEKGYKVIGLGRTAEKVAAINAGKSPIAERGIQRWLRRVDVEATTDPKLLRRCQTVIICVPTPVDAQYTPDLRPIRHAVRLIRRHARRGALVILESTVNPGVSEEVVLPILSEGGRREGREFFLAHCPERINPGDRRWTVRNIPRVVGAISAKGLARAQRFYESILEAPVKPMKTIKEAESVKILENSFRDVNIAFVNEIARSFERLGIDVLDVIEGAKTKPFSFLAHYPSCGVGGHCIPVDPYYLIERAKAIGFNHRFLKLAREINNSMPEYTVELLTRALNDLGKPVRGTRVTVLGVAYKPDIRDTRESPAFEIIASLERLGAALTVYDPNVPEHSTVTTFDEAVRGAEAILLVTAHRKFREELPARISRQFRPVIIDGQNALDAEAIRRVGASYRGIGRA